MTDPRETLAHIRAQAGAASPGPWFDEERNLDKPWDLTTVYYGFHNGETPDRDLVAEASYDNAEFIAASRTNVPRLVDALEKVLELHYPLAGRLSWDGEIRCNGCYDPYYDVYEPYPCELVEAITAALEGETR